MTKQLIEFAHQSGNNYLAQHGNHPGCYFTPPGIALLMANQLPLNLPSITLLDPGSGAGILSAAACQLAGEGHNISQMHIDAWEHNPTLAQLTINTLEQAKQWLEPRNVSLTFTVTPGDFLLHRRFLNHSRPYDAVISNPPYGKLSKMDSLITKDSNFTHGHPNAYTAFMARSVQLLRPNGTAVFLVPRSFTSGSTFQHVRKNLFRCATPTALHLFNSRSDVFKDQGVLQENLLITLTTRDSPSHGGHVLITQIHDSEKTERTAPLELSTDLILQPGKHHLPIPIPTNTDDIQNLKSLRRMTQTLNSLGLTASTGKVIIFRHIQHLTNYGTNEATIPLLHIHQVNPMSIDQGKTKKGKPTHIHVNRDTKHLFIPGSTYILVRRFSPKEQYPRIIAAPLFPNNPGTRPIALENHLNYIHSPITPMDPRLATGLAAYLNSELAQHWARLHVGNTHIGASDLNALPLPTREHLLNIHDTLMERNDPSIENINAAVTSSMQR